MERIFHISIQFDTEKHEKSAQKIVLLPKNMVIYLHNRWNNGSTDYLFKFRR